jgi:hypothetical protein
MMSTLVQFALALVSLPPFALGWIAGAIVRAVLWLAAAAAAGYESGLGRDRQR